MNDKIIQLIQERLEKRKRQYGDQIDVHDGRDWLTESLEEVLDCMVYVSAKILQIKERKENERRSNSK